MRKLGMFLYVLFVVLAMQGQEKKKLFSCMAQNNILNHLDVGVSVGTTGIGIDVALPVTNYVRIRTGYHFMPRFTLHSDFPIETRDGGSLVDQINTIDIDKELERRGMDLENLPQALKEYKDLYDQIRTDLRDYVTMGLTPNFNHFKFLIDILPFKHNKHWSFTAGIYVGTSRVGDACNLERETKILQGVNSYNNFYVDYANNGIDGGYLHGDEPGDIRKDPFFKRGVAGFPLGRFSDGEKAMMVPGQDATVKATMEVSKVRPYVGFGYNTHLSRNKKWNLNVDAGVLIVCGTPKVYVDNVYKFDTSELRLDEEYNYLGGIGFLDEYNKYYGDIIRFNKAYYEDENAPEYEYVGNLVNHVDLVHDLHDMPSGKVRDMVDIIKKLKVYPNLSVTVSYRLF